jgi:hypothetical protein
MNNINMLNKRTPPDKISKILDESDHVRRKQFDCYFPESFKNHNVDLYLEDEDMFYEPQAEKDLQCKLCHPISLLSSMSATEVLCTKRVSYINSSVLQF